MCCGEHEAPAAVQEVLIMAKVYTTTPGAVMRIDNFGDAANEVAAVVPDHVGRELEALEGFRVEYDEPTEPAVVNMKPAEPEPDAEEAPAKRRADRTKGE